MPRNKCRGTYLPYPCRDVPEKSRRGKSRRASPGVARSAQPQSLEKNPFGVRKSDFSVTPKGLLAVARGCEATPGILYPWEFGTASALADPFVRG